MNNTELYRAEKWMKGSELYVDNPSLRLLIDALFDEASHFDIFRGIKRNNTTTHDPYLGVKVTSTGNDSLFYIEAHDGRLVLTHYELDSHRRPIKEGRWRYRVAGKEIISRESEMREWVSKLMSDAGGQRIWPS